MTQQQKTAKRPQDLYAQRGKKLTSAVQRLRGWIGSDPSKNPELADALVELNMHRLLGHDYNAAAPDAQDALRRSAELLTATGPIGPYTSVDDAVRYLTALVHLAVTQAGLGLPESAGRTMSSVDDVLEQLGDLSLQERLDPLTAIWALSCSARGGLASGEIGAANAYADAALARLAESGLRADPDSSYLAMDVDRLAADSRWAAGRPEESLGFLHEAKQRYDQVVDGRSVNRADSVRHCSNASQSRSSVSIGTWPTVWLRAVRSISGSSRAANWSHCWAGSSNVSESRRRSNWPRPLQIWLTTS